MPANVEFLNDVRIGEMRAAVVDGVDVEALFRQAVLRGDDVVSLRGWDEMGRVGSGLLGSRSVLM